MKETVKLELEVPKGVVDFVADLFRLGAEEQPINEFLAAALIRDIKAVIDDLPYTLFDRDKILKKYGLEDN